MGISSHFQILQTIILLYIESKLIFNVGSLSLRSVEINATILNDSPQFLVRTDDKYFQFQTLCIFWCFSWIQNGAQTCSTLFHQVTDLCSLQNWVSCVFIPDVSHIKWYTFSIYYTNLVQRTNTAVMIMPKYNVCVLANAYINFQMSALTWAAKYFSSVTTSVSSFLLFFPSISVQPFISLFLSSITYTAYF